MDREYRINERIRAREVRLIGEAGEQLGIMPKSQALRIARERDLDLAEVAPTSQPPVCRLLDYGKFKYERAKKGRQSLKSQRGLELRQVRMRPRIDHHDAEFKIRLVKRLLEEGNKVKVLVTFRGREITHPQFGKELLEKVTQNLGDAAKVERPLAMEGKNMTLILSPAKQPRGGKSA